MSSPPAKQALVDIYDVRKKARIEEDMSGEERRGEDMREGGDRGSEIKVLSNTPRL